VCLAMVLRTIQIWRTAPALAFQPSIRSRQTTARRSLKPLFKRWVAGWNLLSPAAAPSPALERVAVHWTLADRESASVYPSLEALVGVALYSALEYPLACPVAITVWRSHTVCSSLSKLRKTQVSVLSCTVRLADKDKRTLPALI
jgi:hypothetical protein